MQTLILRVENETKKFLLNTEIKAEVTDKTVNDILDAYPEADWWIEDGWQL